MTAPAAARTIVVIGIGHRFRGDDGIGPRVLDALRDAGPPGVRYVELDGEPSRLIDAWAGADLAVVVDAARSGGPPGTIHRLDQRALMSPGRGGAVSGHGIGLADAAALGEALGRLPVRLRIVAVEVADTGPGTTLSPEVASALPRAVEVVLGELAHS